VQAKKVQLDGASTQLLKTLRFRTGLTHQYLCRLAFCLSLVEPGAVDPRVYDEDGLEFNRYTLMGEWDALLVAYLKEWLLEQPNAQDHDEADWFRAHINRGLSVLPRRVRTLADVGDLAITA
jgi:DNA sulfur modification protein DndE